ncbi:hypothetical protein SP19_67 [Salmonella phage 19]|nr:hypothetical protein SP19_67 [Salmonella phage 19]
MIPIEFVQGTHTSAVDSVLYSELMVILEATGKYEQILAW